MRTLIVIVMLFASIYGHTKDSSMSVTVGHAKHGRVFDAVGGKPVPDVWIVAQWKAYYRGVHGSERSWIAAAEVTRTDSNGEYQLRSQEAAVARPQNEGMTTGHYAFGLLVYAPDKQIDAASLGYCATIGSPPPPFLCPSNHISSRGGLRDEMDDVFLQAATTDLAARAQAYARWNQEAFVEANAAPTIHPRGDVSVEIRANQAQELARLVCSETGAVPYPVIDAILATLPWPINTPVAPVNTFKSVALAGVPCNDIADRCPSVDAAKICEGIHTALANLYDKGTLP